ncbi:replication initiation regulator SeqA, partial [Aggregatibacter actinomycetemcomitans]
EINKPVTRKQSDEVIQKTISKLETLLHSEEFKQENKAVIRFLAILTILYRTNPEGFALATESLQGRTRVYFARDEGTLLMAGNHTKPKQIPDTPYWVITNTNSGRKMLMLEGAMQSMHLPESLIDQVRSFFTAN